MTSFRVFGGRRVLGVAGVTSLHRPRVFHAARPEGGWGAKTLCGKHFLGELQESSRYWHDLASTQRCARCAAELERIVGSQPRSNIASLAGWVEKARAR